MQTKLERLKTILAEVYDLESVAGLLGWDQQTGMPPAAAEGRGYQLSTLESLAHVRFTSAEVGDLLEALEPYAAQLDPDSDDARLIRVTRREYSKRSHVPPEYVAEFAQATALAHQAWEEARPENNFAKFQPHLEKTVALRRSYSEFFAPYDHIYDPLLDDYEPGLKTADVKTIFSELRPKQVALIQAIAGRPQVDNSFICREYEESRQWDFSVKVITQFGYDWKRGRLDKSAHPFTQSMNIDDVRITTRFKPDNGMSALFASMHETGHALYELGIDQRLGRSPLASSASLAIHESQSRMWENLVGRSLPFWQHFYPELQKAFPSQLGDVALERFYRGINKVEPSLIRVEADEATYNLHIMLRLELEIALMENSLDVGQLPEAWNARMEEYLGIRPPNDTKGVLQDVHWSGGMIGYFSTYSLGNLISVQLWECINADIPDLANQIRKGEFAALLSWLREKIHRHGAKYEPQELIQRITGSKIDPAPYIRYLETKYGEIYGI
jgi:carboxypeptidase Taq